MMTAVARLRTDLARMLRHPMNRRSLPFLIAALGLAPAICSAQATIEGKVELPKTHFAPVVNERYEIVSKAGVLATDPPRAVVYLAGDFPKPAPFADENGGAKGFRLPPAAARDRGRDEGGVPEPRRHLSQHLFLLAGQTLRSRALSARGKSPALPGLRQARFGHACAATSTSTCAGSSSSSTRRILPSRTRTGVIA